MMCVCTVYCVQIDIYCECANWWHRELLRIIRCPDLSCCMKGFGRGLRSHGLFLANIWHSLFGSHCTTVPKVERAPYSMYPSFPLSTLAWCVACVYTPYTPVHTCSFSHRTIQSALIEIPETQRLEGTYTYAPPFGTCTWRFPSICSYMFSHTLLLPARSILATTSHSPSRHEQ